LVGYGGEDPGWGPYLGSYHTDVTNEFIAAGVRYGVLGILLLCGIYVAALLGLVRLHRASKGPRAQSLAWCLGSIIVALVVTLMSVSLFGQMVSLHYVVLGIVGSSQTAVTMVSSRRVHAGKAASCL